MWMGRWYHQKPDSPSAGDARVKATTSKGGPYRGVLALLCAGLISLAGAQVLWAAGDTAAGDVDAAANGVDAAAASAGETATGGNAPSATAGGQPGNGSMDDGSQNGITQPAGSAENPSPEASPSPSESMQEPNNEEEPPLPEASPSPTPENNEGIENQTPEVQAPLPGAPSSETAANSVPLPTNPALEQQYSEWDLAQVESPLFLNAAINDFSERPLLLTDNWSVKPHMSIGSSYDGNVFLSSNNNNEQADYITTFRPGLTMRLGNDDSIFYMMADYTVGLNYYLEHPNESTADQDGRAQCQWTMPKTVIGVTLNVSSDTGADVDVQDRVKRELYFAGVTGHYDFGEKTAWDLSAAYTRSDYNGLISSSEWEGDLFFDYAYSPKTQLGVGTSVGYLIVPGSPDQEFEQANVRATYRATGKLTLISEMGMELRELQGGVGDALTPVFIIQAAWDARPGTQLSLSTQRSIYASAILDDQNYTATSLDFTVRQRITDYVDVSLATGYVNTDYSATVTGVDAVREDNYYYIRPAVEWKALSWMSIGIYYEFSRDTSSGGVANGFSRDRGGVEIAILF